MYAISSGLAVGFLTFQDIALRMLTFCNPWTENLIAAKNFQRTIPLFPVPYGMTLFSGLRVNFHDAKFMVETDR